MGKATTTTATATSAEMKKKKKGRPSLSDLRKRALKQQQQHDVQQPLTTSNPYSTPNFNNSNRRSTRRNPNPEGISPETEWIDGEGDDDDERKEKKVKLVVRLPASNEHFHHQPGSSANSFSLNSGSYGSDSNADCENNEVSVKKLKINAVADRSVDVAPNQEEKVSKAIDIIPGSVLESGPTTPLPDKKLLVFILDRLQKKDIYGVFSEPVDANELPDYHEIIEHPMDFGTVRNKLDQGLYSNLEAFEADVLLICSNAMQYNAPDTVYFRQARSIEELAKRDFENLRQVSDDGEPRPKVVRRGRPPGKSIKKSVGRPPLDRVGPEGSSDATLATGGDNVIGSNSYNLRRAPPSYRFQSSDPFVRAFNRFQNNESHTESSPEWNNEFPASILKAEAKYGKKQFSFDENRRVTYQKPSTFGHESSLLTTLNGDSKQLVGVGLHMEHGYARSLARFAANLGPVAWKVASRKIESVLPTGLKFGPGWVEENEALTQPSALSSEKQKSSNNPANDGHPNRPVTPSASGLNSVATYRSSIPCRQDMVEDISRLESHHELAVLRSGAGGSRPEMTFQTRQKSVHQPDRNGINGVFGPGLSSQMGMVRMPPPTKESGKSGLEETSDMASGSQKAPHHHPRSSLPVPPDLNVRFQAPGSPSSSFQIGSPHQPDLALQL